MEEKNKLLNQIHNDASMAAFTIQELLKDLKGKDNKIIPYLEDILEKYASFESEAKNILNSLNENAKDPNIMAKMGSSMKINKEVKCDNSDSAIADMMIQGMTMGLNKIEKCLNEYGDKLDKEHKKLANDFLHFQHEVIEKLREYL